MLIVANKPIMLSAIMLSVILLSVIMLSVIMLSVIMLSVIMLSVIMPECRGAYFNSKPGGSIRNTLFSS